jgi:hypothetical protein
MIVGLPGFARDHARPSGADVFCDSLLSHGVDIQTGQVYGYAHGGSILQSARLTVHRAPRCFLGRILGVDVVVGSTTGEAYASNPQDGQEVSFRMKYPG